MRIGLVIFGALMLALAGCNTKQSVECTADSGQRPVVSIVKDQLESALSKRIASDDGPKVSLSKIRAAINELVIAIEDVRTSKEDPDSTKRFCTGVLKIRFPADILSDADKSRSAVNMNSVSDLAIENDIDRQADSFTASLEYNIQPTDAGDKVFAETESGNNMFGFAAEVMASGLLRSAIEDANRHQSQAEAAQVDAQNAALAEQGAANLNSAKTENQIATQTINAAWKSVSSSTRAQLLPLQRAWIRKKDADCRVESAAASIVPAEIETARLGCDTRITNERIGWLNPYRAADAEMPEPPAPSDE